MTQNQKSAAAAFGVSVLASGSYMLLWLLRVWNYRPWPIMSNMVNYAIVLILFGVSLVVFGNFFMRKSLPRCSMLKSVEVRLRNGTSTKMIGAVLVAAVAYILYYVLYAIDTEMAAPKVIRTALTEQKVVPLFYVLSISFFVLVMYALLRGKDCSLYWVKAGYLVSAVMYFGGLFLVNYFVADAYHGEAYLESVFNVADGVPYEELTTGIYGHYALFFLLPMKIFGARPVVAQIMIALVGVVTDMTMLYCIHHLVEKNWLRLLFAMAVPVVPFAYRQTNYWQLQPHRLVFPVLLAAYMLACPRTQERIELKSKAFLGGWILCMLSVLWNTESGLFCIVGWCAGCLVCWWQQEVWYAGIQWKRYAIMVASAVVAIFGAIGITNLYNLACGGKPIFKIFFYPLYRSSYMDNDIGYPIRLGIRPWLFILLLLMATLAWALFHTTVMGKKNPNRKAPFAACLATLGLVSFSYYANRSAWMNLEICLPEVLLCLCLLIQSAVGKDSFGNRVRGLWKTLRDSAGLISLLVLCIFVAQLPAGVVNTVALYKQGAFSTNGIQAEIQTFSTYVPNNTFAVGQCIGTLYHEAGWNNYGHYVDSADYGVADEEKLKARILDDLYKHDEFVLDNTVCDYLWPDTVSPEISGYVLKTTYESASRVWGAGRQEPMIYYYYVKQK